MPCHRGCAVDPAEEVVPRWQRALACLPESCAAKQPGTAYPASRRGQRLQVARQTDLHVNILARFVIVARRPITDLSRCTARQKLARRGPAHQLAPETMMNPIADLVAPAPGTVQTNKQYPALAKALPGNQRACLAASLGIVLTGLFAITGVIGQASSRLVSCGRLHPSSAAAVHSRSTCRPCLHRVETEDCPARHRSARSETPPWTRRPAHP